MSTIFALNSAFFLSWTMAAIPMSRKIEIFSSIVHLTYVFKDVTPNFAYTRVRISIFKDETLKDTLILG